MIFYMTNTAFVYLSSTEPSMGFNYLILRLIFQGRYVYLLTAEEREVNGLTSGHTIRVYTLIGVFLT